VKTDLVLCIHSFRDLCSKYYLNTIIYTEGFGDAEYASDCKEEEEETSVSESMIKRSTIDLYLHSRINNLRLRLLCLKWMSTFQLKL
jgi:hypothetical protein